MPGTTDLRALLERARGRSVLILGDLMLDHFVIGRVDRISPEAPVPVVQFDHESYRLGGAANVANNVAALGGTVEIAGIVGNDPEGSRLLGSLRHAGISKRGSKLTRSHLVNSATIILSPRIEDHPLKAWGLSLAERAGRGKARVAVARRLAITMLAMWKNDSSYDAALSGAKVCG